MKNNRAPIDLAPALCDVIDVLAAYGRELQEMRAMRACGEQTMQVEDGQERKTPAGQADVDRRAQGQWAGSPSHVNCSTDDR